jgi:hypothetical protein
VQRHPDVEAALREGKLCLSSVVEVAKVLTAENVATVLPRFFGLSSRDAAAVAVAIRPVERPPVREVVVPLVSRAPQLASAAAVCANGQEVRAPELPLTAVASAASGSSPAPASCASSVGPYAGPARGADCVPATVVAEDHRSPVLPQDRRVVEPPEPLERKPRGTTTPGAACACPPRTPDVEPLDAAHARMHLTVSRRFLAKLGAAKSELSHTLPGGTSEQVLEAALDAFLVLRARRKGLVEKPRAPRPAANAQTITAAARREVWRRSQGACEWPLAAGGVCGSTRRLELDHVVPRALGGPSTADNLRAVCAIHNDLAARQVFGDEWMDRYTRRPTDPRG